MAGTASAGATTRTFHFEVMGYEERSVSGDVVMVESEEWFEKRMRW